MLTIQAITKSVNEFVESDDKNNITIGKILLFGSYAKVNPHKYSDIDLAIFSPQFTDNHLENNKAIQFTKRLPQMQLHLYSLKEFEENLFVDEIKELAINLTPAIKIADN